VPYDTQVNLNGAGQFVDLQGNIVDPSKVTAQDVSGEYGSQTVYTAPITTSSLLGNIETGQRIDSPFSTSEVTAPGLFGGEGSTGFHVNFDAQGNPKFSTSTIKDDNSGLASLATIGLSIAFPEFAPLISGASTALQGGNIGDVLKSAALGYAGQQLMGGLNAPEVGPSQIPQELPSSFNQYLAPEAVIPPPVATSYPVPDQTPFQGQITNIPEPVATSYPVPDQTPFQGQITNFAQPETTLADLANIAPQPEAISYPEQTPPQAQTTNYPQPENVVQPQTSLADVAKIAPEQPFNQTPLSDMATVPTETGSQEAIQRLQDNLEQYKQTTAVAPVTTPLSDIANMQPVNYSLASTNPNLEAMGGAQGIVAPDYANLPEMNGAQGFVPTATNTLSPGAMTAPYTIGGNLGQTAAGLISPVPNYTDYSLQPANATQGIVANPNANLEAMGGGQGILPPESANLASMGGGQGLTALAAGGGVLGATGVNTGASLAGNLGASLAGTGLPNANLAGTGLGATSAGVGNLANAAAPITGGSGMGDLLSGLSPLQIASLGSALLGTTGSLISNNAISNAQAAQNASAQKSLGTLGDIYNKNLESIAPYQQAGTGALNQISQQMPYLTHQFDANDLNSQLAPNYQFMLGQGQMANQRAANVGGGALSGNTLTGLNRYTQDYAGNAYQNAFNNYNTQRNNIYNTLSGIAGLGSTANQQGIGAGTAYGTNTTNLNTGLAAANAAATIGKAQNTGSTISSLGNTALLASLLGQNNGVSNVDKAINPYFSLLGGP
jgi:hypothetical protein